MRPGLEQIAKDWGLRFDSPFYKNAFMISAKEALERLKRGNVRYIKEGEAAAALIDQDRREQLIGGQSPFAVILGCSDSRVPSEIIFDQGLGDLFVIRVAGNIVAPSQIGSVEFAVEQFGTRLVVVKGHTCCGAISATLNELQQHAESRCPNLRSIVDRIRPSVETLLDTDLRKDPVALARAATRANIRSSVDQLKHGSALLESLIEKDGLLIVGAEYSIETGRVEFLD